MTYNNIRSIFRIGCLIAALMLIGSRVSVAAPEAVLVDPTQPAGAGAPRRGLVLESTMISPERKLAMINGRVVGVGGRINGAVVTSITPYAVTLRKGKRNINLRLVPKITQPSRTPKQGQNK